MPSVGVVLGAGGIAGGSWHAGTLAALRGVLGWDARTAALVVGTSAGSITGALLRAGLGPEDLLAGSVGSPMSPEGQRLSGRAVDPGPFGARVRADGFRPANPALLRALAPWDRRPAVALAGLLPVGTVDGSSIGTRVEQVAGGPAWPDRPLWVVAVRLSDGVRVVFGRDDGTEAASRAGSRPGSQPARPSIPLGAAVSASSAVPGFFAPVEIGGARYVDGGVHSTTNADLAAGLGFDLVVVSAPMAGSWRSLRAHPASLARTSARVALDREVAAIRRSGTPVLVLQPGPGDTPLMDGRSMDPGARGPVARRAVESVAAQLHRPDAADAAALLRELAVGGEPPAGG